MAKGTQMVNLKRDWFASDGSLYQVRDNSHEFPGHWDLPPTAEGLVEAEAESEPLPVDKKK